MYNLLIGAGASITGKWVHMEPSKDVDFPLGIWVAPHSWSAGNVIIETLLGGLPGNGAGSPYPPQSDTGTVALVTTIPFNAVPLSYLNLMPLDWIRVRTDGGVVGTVDVFAAAQA